MPGGGESSSDGGVGARQGDPGCAASTKPAALAALAVLLTIATVSVPAAAAAPPQRSPAHGPGELLSGPAHGAPAVAALGNDLDVAAARNDMTAAALRGLLLRDRTAWVDPTGHVHYVDPAPTRRPAAAPPEQAPYPYEQTFQLHSDEASDRVIYLDFDGHTVENTAWNFAYGIAPSHPAFDIDGNPGTFSDAERDVVQSVWQRVSEDYAPFDVDVTTEDPGQAAIERSDDTDLEYGTRALISPSSDAYFKICGGACGGVAYIGNFGTPGSSFFWQPAWIFPHALFNDAKYIAEAVSHEVGHNLGLQHDGRGTTPYYEGHAAWAPIMGAGYYRPIVQWSKGEYPSATNTQDDLAEISAHGLSRRTDDHGDSAYTAPTIGPATSPVEGAIGTRTDTDLFRFGLTCTGEVTVQAHPAPTSPDLDIALRLLSSTGTQLTVSNPASAGVTHDLAGGLSSGIVRSLDAGRYFIEVDGVGVYDPGSTGYSDYASLGTYTLDVDGCIAAPPGSPQSVTVTGDGENATASIAWSPPATHGDSPVTGYEVSVDGARVRTVGAAARSASFDALATEVEHTLSVRAVTALGVSPHVDRTVTMPRPLPGQASGVQGAAGLAQATITWAGPSNAFAAAVDGYRIQTYLGSSDTLVDQQFTDGSTFTWTQRGLTNAQPYTFDVTALHLTTMGPVSARSAPVTPTADAAVPGPPEQVAVVQNGQDPSATITWEPPASTGGSAITGYLIEVAGDGFGSNQNLNPAARSATFLDLPFNNELTFSISASNAQGSGPAAEQTITLVGNTVPDPPVDVTGDVDDATGLATLAWQPGGDGGSPITRYVVRINGPDAESRRLGPNARSAVFGPLAYDRDYTMTVRALNALGTGAPVAVVVRREQPTPEAPTGVTATPRDQSARVRWSPPANAEAAGVDGYRVRWFAGAAATPLGSVLVAVPRLATTITGLTNGSPYRFDVIALRGEVEGPPSARTPAVRPFGVPGAPQIGEASSGVAGGRITATARWSPPASSNGSPVTGYQVTALRIGPGGGVVGRTESPVLPASAVEREMRLPRVGRYAFTVRAINAAGPGEESARSGVVQGR